MLELVIIAVATALFFDFYNGVNDAANAVATPQVESVPAVETDSDE